jgi:hypothetical protein
MNYYHLWHRHTSNINRSYAPLTPDQIHFVVISFFLIFQISQKNIRRLCGAVRIFWSVRFYVVSFRDYLGAIAGASCDHFVVLSVFLECTDRIWSQIEVEPN